MNELQKRGMAKWVFILMASILLVFTATLDYNFVKRLLPESPGTAWFSLILFDGGMFGWLFIYRQLARGAIQRGLSMLMSVVSLVGVAILATGELLWESQDLINISVDGLPTMVTVVISSWVLINLFCYQLFELNDPETRQETQLAQITSSIFDSAMVAVDKNSEMYAKKLSGLITDRLIENIVKNVSDQYGNDNFEYEVVRHQAGYQDRQEKKKKRKKKKRKASKVDTPAPANKPVAKVEREKTVKQEDPPTPGVVEW